MSSRRTCAGFGLLRKRVILHPALPGITQFAAEPNYLIVHTWGGRASLLIWLLRLAAFSLAVSQRAGSLPVTVSRRAMLDVLHDDGVL